MDIDHILLLKKKYTSIYNALVMQDINNALLMLDNISLFDSEDFRKLAFIIVQFYPSLINKILNRINNTHIVLAALHYDNNLLQQLLNSNIDWDSLAIEAASIARLDILSICAKHNINMNNVALGAIVGGHISSLTTAIKLGAVNYNDMIIMAAKNGHQHIIDFLLKNYPACKASINDAGSAAIENNHLYIISYLLNRGIDLNIMACTSIAINNIEILNFLINKGASNWILMATSAAKSGNINLLEMLIPHCHEVQLLAIDAAKGGHRECVSLCISYGARDYNAIADAGKNTPEIVHDMVKLGAKRIYLKYIP